MNVIFSRVLPSLGLVVCSIALAQIPPGAGSLSQQIEREQPPRPPQKAAPDIRLEQGSESVAPAAAVDGQAKLIVKSLHVAGMQVFSETELLAVTGFRPQSELTLADLRGMASKIALHYHTHGYFLARAYLPPQDIQNGAVTIAVIEGKYGTVSLRNQTNLSDALANGLLAGLNGGDTIAIAPLESRLLLLSDLPGVSVKSTLVPGASVGASDLIIDVTPGQRVTGSLDADNSGNRYTGENRIGATLNLNDPSGHGDVASLRALTSGSGLNYARASYQMQISKAKVGVAYASMKYRLGKEFDSLQANGTADIASLYGGMPLIRSRSSNLSVLLNYDFKSFQDKVDATSTITDKKADVLMLSLAGDQRDGLGGGGLSQYSLTWASGRIDIRSPAALATDAASLRSNGHFDKLAINAMRLQSVTASTSLYAAINAQFASKNLDISEQIGLGGASGVRAYPAGEAYGDQGYVLNLEARYLLPTFSEHVPGRMQLVGFADTGSVLLNKNPWTGGSNRRTLSGAGIGVNWVDDSNFIVKAFYAHKLGNAKATSAPDESGRFWLQAVKYF